MELFNQIQKYLQSYEQQRSTIKELNSKELEKNQLKSALTEVDNKIEELNSSSLKNILLSLTHKKEATLQELEDELSALNSKLVIAEYEETSLKAKLDTISKENEEIYIQLLANPDITNEIKNKLITFHNFPTLCESITNKLKELKKFCSLADDIYYYGDIHYDKMGHKYNKKEITLKEYANSIKNNSNELVKLLNQYNTIVPSDKTISLNEEWMDNPTYWNNQQIASDSYNRISEVNTWLVQFNLDWRIKNTLHQAILTNLKDQINNSIKQY